MFFKLINILLQFHHNKRNTDINRDKLPNIITKCVSFKMFTCYKYKIVDYSVIMVSLINITRKRISTTLFLSLHSLK